MYHTGPNRDTLAWATCRECLYLLLVLEAASAVAASTVATFTESARPPAGATGWGSVPVSTRASVAGFAAPGSAAARSAAARSAAAGSSFQQSCAPDGTGTSPQSSIGRSVVKSTSFVCPLRPPGSLLNALAPSGGPSIPVINHLILLILRHAFLVLVVPG